MSIVDDRYIVAADLSEGWLDAVETLNRASRGKVVHLIVRIADPTREDEQIRAAAQQLIDEWNATHPSSKHFWDVETTRNTIFPFAWAQRHPEPVDLAVHYLAHYHSDALRGFISNSRGTYFGRIVAYPRGEGEAPSDQLTDTVRKLRAELAAPTEDKPGGGSNKSSRYEINIYNERRDTNPMGFPCLAHISVHLHERRVHMQAVYRNEVLVGRAYGNYLGLAQLQTYIARAAGADVGELLMTINHVELDGSKRAVQKMLAELRMLQY